MKELSLYVLDIFNNSLTAQSSLIRIVLCTQNDRLKLKITDNGKGMDKSFLDHVTDPFATTRTTRKVGMGLALLSQLAQICEGSFKIYSKKGFGTCVSLSYPLSHMDAPPIEDMSGSLCAMIASLPYGCDLIYIQRSGNHEFSMDTREFRENLGDGISFNEPAVYQWIKEYLNDEFEKLQER